MKYFLLVAAAVGVAISWVAGQGQTQCSPSEVFLVARNTCAARCTANVDTCGGNGTCQVLPGGGTGIRNCTCSAGYINSASGALCVPDCSSVEDCKQAGGSCDAPGVCNCATPGDYFTNQQCTPNATCGGSCYGKICTATSCECAPGLYALNSTGGCAPTCGGQCDASKGLECVDPQVCACINKSYNINPQGVCAVVHFVTTPATTPAPTTKATTPKSG